MDDFGTYMTFSILYLISNNSSAWRWSYLLTSTTVDVHSQFPIFTMKTFPLCYLTIYLFSAVSIIWGLTSWCTSDRENYIDGSILDISSRILVYSTVPIYSVCWTWGTLVPSSEVFWYLWFIYSHGNLDFT